ncbi:aminotransferase class I/II-fold pyridoxal phosphate-dependent enzyme [Parahaliea mediterranea]|uniref:aminotransferase class I/II-fold pyridoxal phosphate-dependent enzyme n=1 Tax=Parahaliea mediterranea TaxID=651086 RepID=UPI001F4E9CA1|nr:aminotransferase class I/II-fold pyridoxal phosphate-dependent enzyme [Parahaliea mediterranea]
MSPQPVLVAVVSGDAPFREQLLSALARGAATDARRHGDFDLQFVDCASAAELLQLARERGALQAAVLDVPALIGSASDPAALLGKLRAVRPELDLFLMVGEEDEAGDMPDAGRSRAEMQGTDMQSAHMQGTDIPGRIEWLDRADVKPSQLCRLVRGAIARRARTPFADTLRDYVYSAKDAWHTPGHSGGDSLRDSPWVADFYQLMGEHIFNTDLSVSVQSLDSLLEPHSVIQEAQELAAEAFGARHTFFVTNGTSTANKVIVQHLLGAGGKVILDQACHKSVHHAVILFGAEPVYLPASVNSRYGMYGPVPKAAIDAALEAHPDAKLLVLTSCTYDGFRYDLAPIVEAAHARGIKVLIDEAWYAHGRAHPAFRPNALDCGADYVTQSTHKMLSAFSQASMIHVADPGFDEHRFRENLNMHTSTSPQYAMIASLDVARKQLSLEGYSQLQRCLGIAARLREGIERTGVFRVLGLADMLPESLGDDGIQLDPLKLSVDVSASGLNAREVQLALFEDYGIQIEKVTHNTITVLVTLGATQSKVLRLLNALQKLAARGPVSEGEDSPPAPVSALPPLSAFAMLPRTAFFGPSRERPLDSEAGGINEGLLGAVSADQVVPYPPGIPALNPGQVITREVASYLLAQFRSGNGIELHGLVERGGRPWLRVVDA